MYHTHYNLKTEPFRLSPDHRFCYKHRSYKKAKRYIDYALYRGEGFVVVTGPPGAGKSTLIEDLFDDLRGAPVTKAKLVSTQLQADDLLRMVAYSFGVGGENIEKASLIQRLVQKLGKHRNAGRKVLLVVDEAQDLSPSALEELRLLTNLQEDSKPLLQIFLVGQPGLRDMIRDRSLEQLHQRIVAACHLEPLELRETQAYVEHRLTCAGWKGDPCVTDAAFNIIQQFSDGVPRRINLICSRLFLHGSVEDLHVLRMRDVRSVLQELHDEDLCALDDVTKEVADLLVEIPLDVRDDCVPKLQVAPPVAVRSVPAEVHADERVAPLVAARSGPARVHAGDQVASPAAARSGLARVHADDQAASPAAAQSGPAQVQAKSGPAPASRVRDVRPGKSDVTLLAREAQTRRGKAKNSSVVSPMVNLRASPNRFTRTKTEAVPPRPAARRGSGRGRRALAFILIAVVVLGIAVYKVDIEPIQRVRAFFDGLGEQVGSTQLRMPLKSVPSGDRRLGSPPDSGSDTEVTTSNSTVGKQQQLSKSSDRGQEGQGVVKPGLATGKEGATRDTRETIRPVEVPESSSQSSGAEKIGDESTSKGTQRDKMQADGDDGVSATGNTPAARAPALYTQEAAAQPAQEKEISGPAPNQLATVKQAPPPASSPITMDALEQKLRSIPLTLVRMNDGTLALNLRDAVPFAIDSAKLSTSSRVVLDKLAGALVAHKDVTLRVVGHASRDGPENYNIVLSRLRAEAVATYLRERTGGGIRMSVEGRGSSQPVVRHNSANKALNRRTMLYISPLKDSQ